MQHISKVTLTPLSPHSEPPLFVKINGSSTLQINPDLGNSSGHTTSLLSLSQPQQSSTSVARTIDFSPSFNDTILEALASLVSSARSQHQPIVNVKINGSAHGLNLMDTVKSMLTTPKLLQQRLIQDIYHMVKTATSLSELAIAHSFLRDCTFKGVAHSNKQIIDDIEGQIKCGNFSNLLRFITIFTDVTNKTNFPFELVSSEKFENFRTIFLEDDSDDDSDGAGSNEADAIIPATEDSIPTIMHSSNNDPLGDHPPDYYSISDKKLRQLLEGNDGLPITHKDFEKNLQGYFKLINIEIMQIIKQFDKTIKSFTLDINDGASTSADGATLPSLTATSASEIDTHTISDDQAGSSQSPSASLLRVGTSTPNNAGPLTSQSVATLSEHTIIKNTTDQHIMFAKAIIAQKVSFLDSNGDVEFDQLQENVENLNPDLCLDLVLYIAHQIKCQQLPTPTEEQLTDITILNSQFEFLRDISAIATLLKNESDDLNQKISNQQLKGRSYKLLANLLESHAIRLNLDFLSIINECDQIIKAAQAAFKYQEQAQEEQYSIKLSDLPSTPFFVTLTTIISAGCVYLTIRKR